MAWASALLASLVGQTAESFAGWREDMKSFRIGMIAEPGGSPTVTGRAMVKQS